MKKYFDILQKSPLFSGIVEEELGAILSCIGAKVLTFEKGETIMKEGIEAKNIGIVLLGEVQIEQIDYFGNRNIVTNVMSAELFGESFACADIKNIPIDVVAKEKVEVMLIDCLRITRTCSNACEFHRQLIYNLMKIVAMKNIAFHQKIEVITKRTTREKLLTYLMICAKKSGSSSFEIPYDRQELADYLGVDRSGLSAEIGKLCQAGVIQSKRKWFEILTENESVK